MFLHFSVESLSSQRSSGATWREPRKRFISGADLQRPVFCRGSLQDLYQVKEISKTQRRLRESRDEKETGNDTEVCLTNRI